MTDRLSISAIERPGRIALVDRARTFTFEALAREAAARAEALAGARDRRVLVIARPDVDTAVTIAALLDAHIGFALAHPRWSPRELDDAIARVRPAMIADGSALHPATGRDASNEQVLVFSSGTTGAPKIVRLARSALLAAARSHAEALPFVEDDRWLLGLSPARVGGLSILTRCLWARRAVVLPEADRFDPGALGQTIEARRVTLMSLVPSMLARLLEERVSPGPLRAALLGGAACPPALLSRGRAAGWPLLPTYGMSETCAQICTQRLGAERSRGVGPPLPDVELRLADDGAIEVRGPTLMEGYLDAPPLQGWLRTGDLGRWMEEGHLEVRGRLDDRIVTGGENVDPAEVEAELLTLTAIEDACVVGAPDPRWGEVVTAIVTGDEITLDTVRAHLDTKLARYKHPRRLVRVDALPRNAAGKLDRAAAREALGQRSLLGATRVSKC